MIEAVGYVIVLGFFFSLIAFLIINPIYHARKQKRFEEQIGVCPYCGSDVYKDAVACQNCGYRPQRPCPSCGSLLPPKLPGNPELTDCPSCGVELMRDSCPMCHQPLWFAASRCQACGFELYPDLRPPAAPVEDLETTFKRENVRHTNSGEMSAEFPSGMSANSQRVLSEAIDLGVSSSRVPNVLLIGAIGERGEALAEHMAYRVQATVWTVPVPAPSRGTLAAILTSRTASDVVFCPHIHLLPQQLGDILTEALEKGSLTLHLGAGAVARDISLNVPAVTLVATCDEVSSIPNRLRKCFSITLNE